MALQGCQASLSKVFLAELVVFLFAFITEGCCVRPRTPMFHCRSGFGIPLGGKRPIHFN